MSDLKSFMVALASNVDRLSEFVANPQKVAEEAELSEADRATLFSADQAKLYAALAPAAQANAAKPPSESDRVESQQQQPSATPWFVPQPNPVQGQMPVMMAQTWQVLQGYSGSWPLYCWYPWPYR